MALTSLIIKDKKDIRYLQIITQPKEEGKDLIVVFQEMDETFEMKIGNDQGSDKREEDKYHTELRVAAAMKHQLITSHSTNPEWNPEGYVKHLDDGSK